MCVGRGLHSKLELGLAGPDAEAAGAGLRHGVESSAALATGVAMGAGMAFGGVGRNMGNGSSQREEERNRA